MHIASRYSVFNRGLFSSGYDATITRVDQRHPNILRQITFRLLVVTSREGNFFHPRLFAHPSAYGINNKKLVGEFS